MNDFATKLFEACAHFGYVDIFAPGFFTLTGGLLGWHCCVGGGECPGGRGKKWSDDRKLFFFYLSAALKCGGLGIMPDRL